MNDDFLKGLNGMPNGSFSSSVGYSIHSHNQMQQKLKAQRDQWTTTPTVSLNNSYIKNTTGKS